MIDNLTFSIKKRGWKKLCCLHLKLKVSCSVNKNELPINIKTIFILFLIHFLLFRCEAFLAFLADFSGWSLTVCHVLNSTDFPWFLWKLKGSTFPVIFNPPIALNKPKIPTKKYAQVPPKSSLPPSTWHIYFVPFYFPCNFMFYATSLMKILWLKKCEIALVGKRFSGC